MQETIVIVG